ncbi:N-acetylmuramic acid 6-phosphate etherase [Aureimonas populi]|uniref:N-acetylmuramic acid 6-phosphate etherase n=1 Tax=Aureimonas populi TaxID=1701758 RepID=A0ABW5CR62_9HYPH|nr:N-acetylmuramic acid 6-phosphate etherase [Aureimonas populi]
MGETPETEAADPRFRDLETRPLADTLAALLAGQGRAIEAVSAALPALEGAVAAARPRIEAGGRLVYCGAGTSGRLGLLDAVELRPTFGWPADRALAILAGGPESLLAAREGAEDDAEAGGHGVDALDLGASDVLLAIAASGRTPFTLAACRRAGERGALTIAFANSAGSPLLSAAEHGVLLRTGPEVLAGSTRLAAGTSQKIALNLFSTALMISLGRVKGGRMVAMRASNAKLRARAASMLVAISGCEPEEGMRTLEACDFDVTAALRLLSQGGGGE